MRNIGIDFGTCNIKGAEKKKNGDVKPVKLGKSIDDSRIPNVVLYEKKDDGYGCLIGNVALRKAAEERDKIRHIKSFLQEKEWSRELSFGKSVSASDVVEDIMKNLYNDIYASNKEHELSVTITTPVNFSSRQQELIKRAAQNAGFEVKHIISEPFAAFFYLSQEILDERDDHNVLIFDFGGGTLDLCLISTRDKGEKYEIKTESTVGITYGGNDINEAILENVLRARKPDEVKGALEEQDNVFRSVVNKYYFMESIDELKAELFEDNDCDEEDSADVLTQMFDGTPIDFGEVSVQEIYKMFDNDNWNNKIENLLNKLFEDSSLVPDDTTDIFMVGGTTSIPYFRKQVENYFRKYGVENIKDLFEINDGMDYEDRVYNSVSSGAAIYHELIDDDEYIIKNKIPFVIYTKDSHNKPTSRLTANDSFKGYQSPWALITDDIRKNWKISIYQSVFGEKDKEVYLGDVNIADNYIREVATLYRLSVDENRDIFIEFGLNPPDEDDSEEIWVEGKTKFVIEI